MLDFLVYLKKNMFSEKSCFFENREITNRARSRRHGIAWSELIHFRGGLMCMKVAFDVTFDRNVQKHQKNALKDAQVLNLKPAVNCQPSYRRGGS